MDAIGSIVITTPDAYAARGKFREALECGGDRATALEGRRTVGIAQNEQRSNTACRHASTTLPKRWLGRHRTPKCCARNGGRPAQDDSSYVSSRNTSSNSRSLFNSAVVPLAT